VISAVRRQPLLFGAAVLVPVSLLLSAGAAFGSWRTNEAVKDEARDRSAAACARGNELRTEELPAAFDSFGRFLGVEAGLTDPEIDELLRRFQVTLAGDLPPRQC